MLVLVASLAAALSVSAAPQKGRGGGTSLGLGKPSGVRPAVQADAGDIRVTIVGGLAPHNSSPNFTPTLLKWVEDTRNGIVKVLPYGVLPADPLNAYSVIPDGSPAPWYSTVYAGDGSPMFAGRLNPSAPFDQERGYVMTYMVRLSSVSGGKVRLSMIGNEAIFNSNDGGTDPNGSLYEVIPLPANKAYTILARGYSGDQVTISGSGDQEFDEVIAFFWDNPFNGGGSQIGLDEVRDYLRPISFVKKFSLPVNGTLVTHDIPIGPEPSMIFPDISIEGGNLVFGRSGSLFATDSLGGEWTKVRDVIAGSATPLIGEGNQKFFRLE